MLVTFTIDPPRPSRIMTGAAADVAASMLDEVDVDVTPPAARALLQEPSAAHTAGVVDEDVDPAELGVGLRDRGEDLLVVHDVGRHRERSSSERFDRDNRLRRAVRVDVEDRDVGPVCREPQRDPRPIPAPAPVTTATRSRKSTSLRSAIAAPRPPRWRTKFTAGNGAVRCADDTGSRRCLTLHAPHAGSLRLRHAQQLGTRHPAAGRRPRGAGGGARRRLAVGEPSRAAPRVRGGTAGGATSLLRPAGDARRVRVGHDDGTVWARACSWSPTCTRCRRRRRWPRSIT